MTLKKTIFLSIVLCLNLSQNLSAQKGDLVLNFSGKDAVTNNVVPLESVKVSNETQGGDTTLYGAAPTLSLQWASGIFEQNRGQKASFILEPNYPNPFTENTTVNIRLRKPQHLIITLYDQQGAVAANLEQDFGFGTHRFEITVPQNRLCLFTVNDGVTAKTLKMFSTTGKDYRIKYLGMDENARYKSETETAAFVFQPGDVLKFTVNAVGYHEYITYDNPVASMNYVFSLQPNTTELPPTVTTAAVTNISATTAACGGNVTNEGSAAVTARGVCWSTSQNPTIANSFSADGSGVGSFTSAITGLTESTNYYVRAYATNQFGTAYGNEMSFISAQALPTVTTANATNINSTSASSGGNVTSEGSAAVTARGVCWNTSQNPTIANSFTVDGSGLGSFTSNITGLTGSTTYYVRAYATNQFGTAYGNEMSFTTEIQEQLYRCDSAISYNTNGEKQKTKFAYDSNGHKLLWLVQNWNIGYGVWVNEGQNLYTYDASGNMLSELSQEWNINIGCWVNHSNYFYSYDDDGNRVIFSIQLWSIEIGCWVNYLQELYSYDESGNRLSSITQDWNINISSWVNNSKTLYAYDLAGNTLSVIGLFWNTNIGSWENSWKTSFTYDVPGNIISELNQNWNTNIGSWVNSFQFFWAYDNLGNRISEIEQYWNTTIGIWENNWKITNSFDTSGNMLSYTYQSWNTNYGSWVNSFQGSFTYDDSGNMLSSLGQEWNSSFGTWVNTSHSLYTYDASGNILSSLYQGWDTNIGNWTNVSKTEYQYDYTTRKITALSYEWSGGWMPVNSSTNITIFDNNIFIGGGYKLDVWYNSYPSVNKDNNKAISRGSGLFDIHKPSKGRFSNNNPYEKEAGFESEFSSLMHAKEAWLNENENRMPSHRLPQRQVSVGNTTMDLNHSK